MPMHLLSGCLSQSVSLQCRLKTVGARWWSSLESLSWRQHREPVSPPVVEGVSPAEVHQEGVYWVLHSRSYSKLAEKALEVHVTELMCFMRCGQAVLQLLTPTLQCHPVALLRQVRNWQQRQLLQCDGGEHGPRPARSRERLVAWSTGIKQEQRLLQDKLQAGGLNSFCHAM